MNKKQRVEYLCEVYYNVSREYYLVFLMCCFSLVIFSKKIIIMDPKEKIFNKCNSPYLKNNMDSWLYSSKASILPYIAMLHIVLVLYSRVVSPL